MAHLGRMEREAEDLAEAAAGVTVRQDGLREVHASATNTALYPVRGEEGLALHQARKHCLSELVRVQGNPLYVLSLRTMADSLDSMLLNHKFELSEAGRYFQEHRADLRLQLLDAQAAVKSGRRTLASVWDEVMWAPLVERFGAQTPEDRAHTARLVLFTNLLGDDTGDDVVAWLHTLYKERVDLASAETLAPIMAKAVNMAKAYCEKSKRYGRSVPRYMNEFATWLNDLQQGRVTRTTAEAFFQRLRSRVRGEGGGDRLLQTNLPSDEDEPRERDLTAPRRARFTPKAKTKVRVFATEQREYPRAEYYSDDEEAYQEEARAQAYVIDNRASTQSVRPPATAAPALAVSAWDRQFHDLMTPYPHVGLKWLALVLQTWPRDLPVDPVTLLRMRGSSA